MAAGTKTVATLVELGGWLIGQWVWDNKTYWEAVGHSLQFCLSLCLWVMASFWATGLGLDSLPFIYVPLASLHDPQWGSNHLCSPAVAACPTFNFLNYTVETMDNFENVQKIRQGKEFFQEGVAMFPIRSTLSRSQLYWDIPTLPSKLSS